MSGKEVEYVAISQDTTESDLKQAPVRAAINGRVLVIDDERVQRDLSSIIQFDDKQDKAPVRSMYPFIDHRAWYPPSKYPELQHVLIVPGVYDDKSFKPLELKAYDSDFMNENKEYTAVTKQT
ncbi:uncharacterized protein PITG_04088 [Phytophthora infestans T30-4]|uniref:Uncharacterized protein n=1 Tax=Phytophthora infestans (strain T30-4) TaxID=403677 RepID=D0N0I8_PHYIT|nr:uncharacterized protein PITG_04088 [Phytophthora infestans T30-4]EEY67151.1 hypothetical protein PITG_04088 [Phytophthora infestans T30-4]|eukprot:XP_002905799.1 hypothetical protein PITG_04088 [Phytophthora infestans T30-4]